MKSFTLSAISLVLLYLATTANALACSCLGEKPLTFWDLVSPYSKNAMVKFEELVQAEPIDGHVYGRFVVLENYNTADFKVNDMIILNSVANTCGVYLPAMSAGDTLLVALDSKYELYAACAFNSMGVRNGYAGEMSMEEVKARIMTITNSPKDLVVQKNMIVYPNPAISSLTVKFPHTGRLPNKIEVLDMSGRVVKTKEINCAEVVLDVQNIPKGLYLLKLSYNGSGSVLRKWVKA
ncbi:T9SS type A sorting domain-containing protein [Botryobacter ruber]|uniref:T9SS type A sorting domain-containing protein n=1 Tax=Botryobacter ruber TaxID=2171629 RepID=UPI000E0C62BC|nr:T9SS type A sorting domain-containing protein [Botryobacter ruber]